MGSANQSARTYIGVGPRHSFMFNGTGAGITTDNLLGGVTASYTGIGAYYVEHGIGNTGYAALFTAEHSSFANITVTVRGTNGITLEVDDAAGANINPGFVFGCIHDGGG